MFPILGNQLQYQLGSDSLCPLLKVILATFGTFFAISDELLTGERTLIALLPFNILQFVLDMFPNLISNIVQASVSLSRLWRFLQIDEIDPDNKETRDKLLVVCAIAISL